MDYPKTNLVDKWVALLSFVSLVVWPRRVFEVNGLIAVTYENQTYNSWLQNQKSSIYPEGNLQQGSSQLGGYSKYEQTVADLMGI